MGIRFWCPNGHKLHVKSFLAGKRGICPECGVKVIIPQESQSGPAEEADLADLKAAAAENDAARIQLGPPPEPRPAIPPAPRPRPAPDPRVAPDPLPARTPAAPSVTNTPFTAPSPVVARESAVMAPTTTGGRSGPVIPGLEIPAVAMDRPAAEPAAPASGAAKTGVLPALVVQPVESVPSDLPDPFAAAPAAIWYVRPPQGGQYGPATSAVMRGWVEDGRVPPESHVWAEGWPEWRRAVAVIPAAMLDAAGKRLQGAVTLTANTEVPSSSTVMMRRRRTRRWSATVVALLCVLCAILFVALIYVIKFMN